MYAGLYAVIGNALRPIRFSIAVALTPVFDRFVDTIQTKWAPSHHTQPTTFLGGYRSSG